MEVTLDDAAVIICAGPSLDLLSAYAWEQIKQAQALVSVNGALAAEACRNNDVALTYAAAMDITTGLAEKVPGFMDIWQTTSAWRVAANVPGRTAAESYIDEVHEPHNIHGWSDEPSEGYAGGSTAIIVGNWLCKNWPRDAASVAELELVSRGTGKQIPPRGFKRLAYIGLDMIFGDGRHAKGAGDHRSGFTDNIERDQEVRRGWGKFCREGERRGVEIFNLTPHTGLEEMNRKAVPKSWLLVPSGEFQVRGLGAAELEAGKQRGGYHE